MINTILLVFIAFEMLAILGQLAKITKILAGSFPYVIQELAAARKEREAIRTRIVGQG